MPHTSNPAMRPMLMALALLSSMFLSCGGASDAQLIEEAKKLGEKIGKQAGKRAAKKARKAKNAQKAKKAKKAKKARKAKNAQKAKKANTTASYTKAQKCAEPCLFMLEHSFETVERKLCTWCPTSPEAGNVNCIYHAWPSVDVPRCDLYRRLKNCIYAGYGYPFKNKRWQREFESKKWYRADPAYDKSKHSKVANANIKELSDIAILKPGARYVCDNGL